MTTPQIGDVIFDWGDNHKFTIFSIEGECIKAECCHGDIIEFKEGERKIYREVRKTYIVVVISPGDKK